MVTGWPWRRSSTRPDPFNLSRSMVPWFYKPVLVRQRLTKGPPELAEGPDVPSSVLSHSLRALFAKEKRDLMRSAHHRNEAESNGRNCVSHHSGGSEAPRKRWHAGPDS